MTCAHVLGLIDAGPFASFPRAHLDAARRHASQCATCGPALEASTALARGLAALAQPGPAPDLTAVVMARIARIEPADSAGLAAANASSTARDPSAGATALGSLAAGLAALATLSSGPGTIDLTSPRVGGIASGLLAMPAITAWAFVLATSLGLYAAGLFAPVGGRNPR